MTTATFTAPVAALSIPDAVDFYAGGGGASFGLHNAGLNVLAALNHNANAIATHAVNFRQTQHFLADIFKQSESAIPKAQLAWFSPSCVFHSVARGGQHCNEQERAHAEQMPRFCFAMNVQCVMVENIREFVKWVRSK